jgi:hypothetical protein
MSNYLLQCDRNHLINCFVQGGGIGDRRNLIMIIGLVISCLNLHYCFLKYKLYGSFFAYYIVIRDIPSMRWFKSIGAGEADAF